MPVCFQLSHKDRPHEPISHIAIDEAMCAALGQPVDPEKYLWGWYDTIGLRLALGQSFESMIVEWQKVCDSLIANDKDIEWVSRYIAMAQWLQANYVSYHWREVGRD